MRKLSFCLLMQLSMVASAQAQIQSEPVRSPSVTTSVARPVKGVNTITTEELKKYVDEPTPHVYIIDARPAKKDDGERIPSAKPIPYDASIENVTANLPDKNALIIVYCQNAACGASDYLANQLTKWGYQNVLRYVEGLDAWKAAGYSVNKGVPATQSKMRQPIEGLPNPNYNLENR